MGQSVRLLNYRSLSLLAPLALTVLAIILLTGCGDGMSRAEVEEIVREEMAEAPTPPLPEPGLSAADVEEAIRKAMADMPEPETGLSRAEVDRIIEKAIAAIPEAEPGLTSADVEEIVKAAVAAIPQPSPGLTSAEAEQIARGVVASIPPKSAPAEYTKFFVNNAISRYETQGLEATLAYYNREESIDGQWYVFIVDENDLVIGHPDAHRLGLDLKGWVTLDATGYNFGPDMLSATEDGKWVSYVYQNPESGGIGDDHTGALEYKHVWVVRHDGLLFASGWHISADAYTKYVVDEAIAHFHADGLEETLAYHNSRESVDGQWYVFIADGEGRIVAHHDPNMLGKDLDVLLGTDGLKATGEGMWVNHQDVNPATGEVEDKHFWLVEHDGLVFGSGWHHDESGG